MAVVRVKAEIRCVRDLYNFTEANLKTTRSHNCKRRIFKYKMYIEEVERNNKSFQPIRGIRAIHRIEKLDSKRY